MDYNNNDSSSSNDHLATPDCDDQQLVVKFCVNNENYCVTLKPRSMSVFDHYRWMQSKASAISWLPGRNDLVLVRLVLVRMALNTDPLYQFYIISSSYESLDSYRNSSRTLLDFMHNVLMQLRLNGAPIPFANIHFVTELDAHFPWLPGRNNQTLNASMMKQCRFDIYIHCSIHPHRSNTLRSCSHLYGLQRKKSYSHREHQRVRFDERPCCRRRTRNRFSHPLRWGHE